MKQNAYPSATLLRRLSAAMYDGLLLVGLLMVAGAFAIAANSGEAIDSQNWLFRGYLLGVASVFYLWFWTHGGQTLGMRAWRMRLIKANGEPVRLPQALLRLPLALVAWSSVVGLVWCLFDPRGRALHDILSGSLIVVEPKS